MTCGKMVVEQFSQVPKERSLIQQLLGELGKEEPDIAALGRTLLLLSQELLTGVTSLEPLDNLSKGWEDLVTRSFDTSQPLAADLAGFLEDVKGVGQLSQPLEAYTFPVPWGSGTVRVLFRINQDGEPKLSLADDGGMTKVKENFSKQLT